MGVRWGRSDVRQSEGEDTQYDAVRGGREVGHVAAAFCAAWRCKNWPPVRSPFADACRRIGVTEQSYYRWRKEYGGLKMDQARRMKELERENARLRRLVADLSLDKAILTEAARGNF